jgi:hypothetical protein
MDLQTVGALKVAATRLLTEFKAFVKSIGVRDWPLPIMDLLRFLEIQELAPPGDDNHGRYTSQMFDLEEAKE